ncbi:hypothetical protein [Bradyrhizobium zhanjiangense]|uniref:hypothetical protein n=1 Tax=Bradyrhizobium zhanjiangense TaxID=1325107 RepID=UPI0010087CA5|nr:hypothetical protein [Bradyrhizobium zhanjiangense]
MAALWLVVQFGILHLVISIRKIVRRAMAIPNAIAQRCCRPADAVIASRTVKTKALRQAPSMLAMIRDALISIQRN